MEKYSKYNCKSILIWLSLVLFFIPHSNGCFSRNSPYRGFGLCLDVWEWRCPYEKKCIEAWQVCDGWVDCISGKDEVPNHNSNYHHSHFDNYLKQFDPFQFQSRQACREKDEMACKYEKWRWMKLKTYFLSLVSRQGKKKDDNTRKKYMYTKSSSVSNCC